IASCLVGADMCIRVSYITKPHLKVENKPINDSKDCLKKAFSFDFKIDSEIKLDDIMRENSTSRRSVKNE
ncbi:MAG: hypothetical protein K2J20_06145, partial [Bacilli bacterium]|nr:hypothetical protein [Bacilli bacterium]